METFMANPRQSAMQRIQVGTLGLVAVLILVTAANMVISRADSGTQNAENAQLPQDSAMTAPSSQEPLAEIGVAAQVDANQQVKKTAAPKILQPGNVVAQPERATAPTQ
jgi:hypothetical protein